jgi:hypothetical protein
MTISITLNDLTVEQLRAITDVLGGDTPVQVVPTPPTLNGEPVTDAEIAQAVVETLGATEEVPAPPSLFDAKPAPTGEVDKAGMPWDKRIHASTKTQTQKGLWKKKKGVAAELVAQVEAELLGKSASTETTAPVASTIPPAPPIVSTQEANTQQLPDFNQTMMLITGALSNGDLEMDEVTEIVAKFGGGDQGLQSLVNAPHAIPMVYTEVNGLING